MNQEIKIKKLLQELGVTPDIKGYHYLAEAIAIKARANQNNDFAKKHTIIYEEVAEKFETTYARVERAIRHAVGKAFGTMSITLRNLFGTVINQKIGKVTNSCFISMVAEHITFTESEG